jgi:hypothetical protein
MGAKPVMTKEEDVWVIRVENPTSGKTQEYRCATERQAKQLMLALQPKDAPVPK